MMNKRNAWIKTRIRTGWILLAAGVVVCTIGALAELQFESSAFNLRIITGAGILLTGGGIGYLVRYRGALKDEESARRLSIEERDERTVLIRMRAGNRAFWASVALAYLGLMWASFAANGDLPELAGDTLWYFLAVCVLVPMGIYIGSILIDQRSS